MAAAITGLQNPVGNLLVTDTAVTKVVVGNASGGSGSLTLYQIEADNTANSAVTYLKLYGVAAPTIGTTEPVGVFKIKASTKEYYVFTTGLSISYLTYLTTTTASNAIVVGSIGAPANALNIKFVCKNATP
jgi:hypothetical protein